MKIIGYLATFLITAIGGSIWRGYVLSVLWGWFVVTTFGARPLGIAAAIGVSCVVSFLTFHYRPAPKDDREAGEKIGEACVLAFLGPAFSLLFGYIVKFWL